MQKYNEASNYKSESSKTSIGIFKLKSTPTNSQSSHFIFNHIKSRKEPIQKTLAVRWDQYQELCEDNYLKRKFWWAIRKEYWHLFRSIFPKAHKISKIELSFRFRIKRFLVVILRWKEELKIVNHSLELDWSQFKKRKRLKKSFKDLKTSSLQGLNKIIRKVKNLLRVRMKCNELIEEIMRRVKWKEYFKVWQKIQLMIWIIWLLLVIIT